MHEQNGQLVRRITHKLLFDDSQQMDLSSFISKTGCECLNEADDHVLAHALTSKGGYLESDCDEQVNYVKIFLV